MSGMSGITDALVQLLEALGVPIHPWTLPALALVVMGLLSPLILKNLKTGKARKLLKRARILSGAERQRLEAAALDEVGDHPMGLVAVAEEALRLGRKALARDAVARLARTGKARGHLRRLNREIDPDPLPPTVDATVLVIERLLEGGLVDEADRRLGRAHSKFGAHDDFIALAAQIERARDPANAST